MRNEIGEASGGPSNSLGEVRGAPALDCRVTAIGYYYRLGDFELGPFTLNDRYEGTVDAGRFETENPGFPRPASLLANGEAAA